MVMAVAAASSAASNGVAVDEQAAAMARASKRDDFMNLLSSASLQKNANCVSASQGTAERNVKRRSGVRT
jgi:hypothetical protein